MTESELESAIDRYVDAHKKLPDFIYANYRTGVGISYFSNYVSVGDYGCYRTPFGIIPIKLEPQAADILFESYDDIMARAR